MANRNPRNDQAHENVPDINMTKFIESVGAYFPDLDVSVGQEKNIDPRSSGFVLTFTSSQTAAMFAAYQIGRRSAEYVPGGFVLARLDNNRLVFEDREVYLTHPEAARAQRNKSRSTRQPYLLFSTTQRTMEYASGVAGCNLEDLVVSVPAPQMAEQKNDRFTPSQLKFLEKHLGSMMDRKIQESVDELKGDLWSALNSLKEDLCGNFVPDDDDFQESSGQKAVSEMQDELQFGAAGLTD